MQILAVINNLLGKWRHYSVHFVALLISVIAYQLTVLPQLPENTRTALASDFAFEQISLSVVGDETSRNYREVHPSLNHVSAWISAFGAAVALHDLDGDGLPNDVCLVDVRQDEVLIMPAPTSGDRFAPFILEPPKSPYLTETTAPTGCLPGDLNEDGLTDILVYFWGRTPVAFLQNQGAGNTLALDSFTPIEIVPENGRWFTNAATLTDMDGDGHYDLIIANYFPDGARILETTAGGQEQMPHSLNGATNGGGTHLFLWNAAQTGENPSVNFVEALDVLPKPMANAWTLGVGAADLDGDMLPELYFANDFGHDWLLHNRSIPGDLELVPLAGPKQFTTPHSKVLGQDSFKGMGVDFADLNGDLLLDIYVSNITSEFAFQESHFVFLSTGEVESMAEGKAPYVDRSEQLGLSRSGWGWETRLADFNNDGVLEALQATGYAKGEISRWPELQELGISNDNVVSNPQSWFHMQPGDDLGGDEHNPFYVRAADGRFYDLSPELNLDNPQVTRGIATADIDGDGDLDFVIANQWAPSVFYINNSQTDNQFLGLNLLLPIDTQTEAMGGRPAIGAQAIVHLPDGRQLVAQVDGGNGHSGVRSSDLHFGLGNIPADATIPVDITWRDNNGQVQKISLNLSPGWQTIILVPNTE